MNRDVGAVVDREPDRTGFRQGFDEPRATSFEIRDLTIDGFEASPLDIGGLVARTSAFDQKHAVREATNVVNGETGRDHALDHPRRVTAYASLTVVPTLDAFARVDKTFALDAWHRFFLAQPADLPERMLAADPDAYIDAALRRWREESSGSIHWRWKPIEPHFETRTCVTRSAKTIAPLRQRIWNTTRAILQWAESSPVRCWCYGAKKSKRREMCRLSKRGRGGLKM